MPDTHTANEAAQLETALGLREQKLEIRGQVITVREFSLAQIPALLRLIAEVKKSGRIITTWVDPEGGAIPLEKEDFIQGVLENGEQAMAVIRLACDGFNNDLPVSAMLPVIGAVFEVNADFFDQLKGFGDGKLNALIKKIGATPGRTS